MLVVSACAAMLDSTAMPADRACVLVLLLLCVPVPCMPWVRLLRLAVKCVRARLVPTAPDCSDTLPVRGLTVHMTRQVLPCVLLGSSRGAGTTRPVSIWPLSGGVAVGAGAECAANGVAQEADAVRASSSMYAAGASGTPSTR